MRRLIVDTDIYLDWLNAGEHEPVLFQPDAVKFMSAVVMMELLAVAHPCVIRHAFRISSGPWPNLAELSPHLRAPTNKPARCYGGSKLPMDTISGSLTLSPMMS